MMAQQKKTQSKLGLISDASKAEIDRWVAKYPPEQKRSAVMAALRILQDQNKGYLTNDLMDAVAEYLQMPAIAVYEVATFYSMYELDEVGTHKICVCTNISCMLRGSDEIVEHLFHHVEAIDAISFCVEHVARVHGTGEIDREHQIARGLDFLDRGLDVLRSREGNDGENPTNGSDQPLKGIAA